MFGPTVIKEIELVEIVPLESNRAEHCHVRGGAD